MYEATIAYSIHQSGPRCTSTLGPEGREKRDRRGHSRAEHGLRYYGTCGYLSPRKAEAPDPGVLDRHSCAVPNLWKACLSCLCASVVLPSFPPDLIYHQTATTLSTPHSRVFSYTLRVLSSPFYQQIFLNLPLPDWGQVLKPDHPSTSSVLGYMPPSNLPRSTTTVPHHSRTSLLSIERNSRTPNALEVLRRPQSI